MDPTQVTRLNAHPSGNYSYLAGGFQYSAAVIADSGYAIERARFTRPVPIAEGFARIRLQLEALGRPLAALCACELRSPAVMSEPVFNAFNREYIKPLADWGLFKNDINPVARCNLAPAVTPPAEPCFWGFSYTVPAATAFASDFVTSGAFEGPDRPGSRDNIVRLGETMSAESRHGAGRPFGSD